MPQGTSKAATASRSINHACMAFAYWFATMENREEQLGINCSFHPMQQCTKHIVVLVSNWSLAGH